MNPGNFSEESLREVEEMLYEYSSRSAKDLYFPALNKKCPQGTYPVGAGFCRNPQPDRAGYIQAIKKQCPPNTRAVGAGWCKVSY
jgi:hypothetical protein